MKCSIEALGIQHKGVKQMEKCLEMQGYAQYIVTAVTVSSQGRAL